MSKVLVTGGTGYIASHAVVALIENGYTPVLFDNLSNSKLAVLDRIRQISNQSPDFINGDLLDGDAVNTVFKEHSIDSVIHFAGLKAVGESVAHPQRYYENNVIGTLNLTRAMSQAGCFKIVFSSSATVYGEPEEVPVTEKTPLSTTNPYGRTKLIVEQILADLVVADSRWQAALLRYFNPIGAHQSGLIGEDPNGIPNNLVPYMTQVAAGRLKQLEVYGNDYDTRDGTGVRDYIHVVDLADAHVKALAVLRDQHGCQAYNLGTGQGSSVLDLIAAFEEVNGITIPYKIVARRAGDIASCYADPSKSEREIGWNARFGIEAMMQDHWRWQQQNPFGYK